MATTMPQTVTQVKQASLLKQIYLSTLKFLTSATTQEVYRTIVSEAVKLLHARYGTILISQNDVLKRVYANSPVIAATPISQRGRTYQVSKTKQVKVTKIEHPQDINRDQFALGIRTIVFIPLYYSDQTVGVMNIFSLKEKDYSKEELNLMQLFGSLASLAIRKAQFYDQARFDLENRRAFASFAAHEIKTPLTAICAYSQLIANKAQEGLPVPASIAQTLCDESQRMSRLVKNLLGSGTDVAPVKQFFHLNEVIALAVAEIRFLYPSHEVVFNSQLTEGQDKIYGDADKILQIAVNLLNNACKFSKPGSEVEVCLKGENQEILLSVKDRGVGIIQKDKERIFDRFFTKSQPGKGGMGIGLYLVKNFVELHGGKISVVSKKGRGTTFQIKLPRKA